MATDPCLVLYGNSVFLAGLKAELERDPTLPLELISVDAGCPPVTNVICEHKPCAVLFDLAMDKPGFVVSILRGQPSVLMIGVDPSSDQMLVLSGHSVQALAIHDLVQLILENPLPQERNPK